jgi:hypothetical protein
MYTLPRNRTNLAEHDPSPHPQPDHHRRGRVSSDAVTTPEITVATPADRERVVGSLVAAFVGDPVLRYLFPDDGTYPRYAAAFFGHLFDKRVRQATIWTIGHGASVAMWDALAAAHRPADDTLAAHLPTDALARVNAYDQAVRAMLPTTPFWYLGVLGAHPDHAGRRWRPRRHGGRVAPRRSRRPAGDPGDQQPGQRRGVSTRRLAGGARRDARTIDRLDHATVDLLTSATTDSTVESGDPVGWAPVTRDIQV